MMGSLVSPLKSYVTRLEHKYFDPAVATQSILQRLNNTVSNVFERAKGQPCDLSQLYAIEEEVSKQLDRFWAWASRRIIDVTEACKVFNKSRSTIYRWIKQGKIPYAIKDKGKWRIAI